MEVGLDHERALVDLNRLGVVVLQRAEAKRTQVISRPLAVLSTLAGSAAPCLLAPSVPLTACSTRPRPPLLRLPARRSILACVPPSRASLLAGTEPCLVREGDAQIRQRRHEVAIVPAAQPTACKPSQAQPSQAKPSPAKPSQAKPSQANPSQAKPSQAKPSQAKPSPAKPSQAKAQSRAARIPRQSWGIPYGATPLACHSQRTGPYTYSDRRTHSAL